jgi:hypothetical protein
MPAVRGQPSCGSVATASAATEQLCRSTQDTSTTDPVSA